MSQSKRQKKNDFSDLSDIDAARLIYNAASMAEEAGKKIEIRFGPGWVGIMLMDVTMNRAGQVVASQFAQQPETAEEKENEK